MAFEVDTGGFATGQAQTLTPGASPTFTGLTLTGGQVTLNGSSSGTQILKAAAAASGTITFPAGTTDFSATGGTSQVVKQTSAGGAFTVAQLAQADISGLTTASSPTFTGLTLSGITAGSILYAGVGGAATQDNANFFYGGSGHLFLGSATSIGQTTPSLLVKGTKSGGIGVNTSGAIVISDVAGNAIDFSIGVDSAVGANGTAWMQAAHQGISYNPISLNPAGASVMVNGGVAIPAGGTAGAGLTFSTTTNFGVFFGSGAPSLAAAKGSLYLRSDGSGVADRMYVNTNGSTTWTAVATAG